MTDQQLFHMRLGNEKDPYGCSTGEQESRKGFLTGGAVTVGAGAVELGKTGLISI